MKNLTEIEALEAMPDNKIDTSDIPEITNWNNAVVGKFYRPIKKPVTIRLDIDVVEWFKSQDGKYQSNINNTLREAMQNDSAIPATKESILDDEEAENLKIKAQLMQQLTQILKDTFNTPEDATIILGIEESKINNLIHGEIQKLTIDNLISMMNKLGYSVELKTKLAA